MPQFSATYFYSYFSSKTKPNMKGKHKVLFLWWENPNVVCKWPQLVFMCTRGTIESAPPGLVLPLTECECDKVYTLYTH